MADLDPQLAAFHRLLVEVASGAQAKRELINALLKRRVFVAHWPGGIDGWRTLVNAEKVIALPVFTSAEQLVKASRTYQWVDVDGAPPCTEVSGFEVVEYAYEREFACIVLDIATPEHVLDLTMDDLKWAMDASVSAEVGELSRSAVRTRRRLVQVTMPDRPSDVLDASESHERPSSPEISAERSSLGSPMPAIERESSIPPPPPSESEPESTASRRERIITESAELELQVRKEADPELDTVTFGGGTSVTVSALLTAVPDELYDVVTAVLRAYPEVEWACICQAARGPTSPVPTVGVRIDPGFRTRVNELLQTLRDATVKLGATLDILLLDDVELMRNARQKGEVFYPWRG